MPACLLLICARRLHSHVMRRFTYQMRPWSIALKFVPDWSTLMSKLGLPPLIKWGLGPCLEIHRWLCSHVLKFVPHRENAKQSKPASIEFVNEIHHTSQEPMPFILMIMTSCKSKYWDLNRVGHRISLFLFLCFLFVSHSLSFQHGWALPNWRDQIYLCLFCLLNFMLLSLKLYFCLLDFTFCLLNLVSCFSSPLQWTLISWQLFTTTLLSQWPNPTLVKQHLALTVEIWKTYDIWYLVILAKGGHCCPFLFKFLSDLLQK